MLLNKSWAFRFPLHGPANHGISTSIEAFLTRSTNTKRRLSRSKPCEDRNKSGLLRGTSTAPHANRLRLPTVRPRASQQGYQGHNGDQSSGSESPPDDTSFFAQVPSRRHRQGPAQSVPKSDHRRVSILKQGHNRSTISLIQF